jgi:YHS domain-containing protein
VAGSPVDAVNKDRHGVALQGYDPVAYFEQNQPVKGSPQFTYSWMGAVWNFASDADLKKFQAAPEKYAPQFGGYCAWAVSNNYTADADPNAWKIVDGRLYVNYNKDVQKKWEENIGQRIEAARKNWPALHK